MQSTAPVGSCRRTRRAGSRLNLNNQEPGRLDNRPGLRAIFGRGRFSARGGGIVPTRRDNAKLGRFWRFRAETWRISPIYRRAILRYYSAPVGASTANNCP